MSPSRRLARWIVLTAAAAVALGAVGWKLHDRGSSSFTFTREHVASQFSEQIRNRVETRGGTMSRDLECIEDGDATHYRCLADFTLSGQRYTFSITVTCDQGNGRCISEPATIAPG